jgi:hypothetical protein
MTNVLQNLPGSVATNPGNGGAAWVVRCVGTTSNTGSANVRCDPVNNTLTTMLAAAGTNDVLLVGGGAASALAGQTIRLPVGTALTSATSAPTLSTQFGSANLATIFGTPVGAQPSFTNGVISIGSNTTIAGFTFTDTSITNYSTSNVVISGNIFTGSYTPGVSALNTYNQNALPTIALTGVSNVTIAGNTFTNPNVQSYTSTTGNGGFSVCDETGYASNICLSGNAIRISPSSTGTPSSNITISSNTISGALDEAIRFDNVQGIATITGNTISGMRNGPNSNMQAAIFIRQWTGNSQITIENNRIVDNQAGLNAIAIGSSVASGTFSSVGGSRNNVDALEIGLCRGNQTFSNRAGDKYGDDFGGFNCSPTAPASMTYTARGNTLQPSANALAYDEDGIDFNVGSYGFFNANVINNYVEIKSNGNNAFTKDFRGAANVNISLTGNTLISTNDPIDISASTIFGLTSYSSTGGSITITGNTIQNSTNPNQLIDVTARAKNPSSVYATTPIVTPVYNITMQNNTIIPSMQFSAANIDFDQFYAAGSSDYPLFYVNGALQTDSSPTPEL